MAIADLLNKTAGAPHKTCAACHALDTLPDDKAAILVDLLSNERVKYTELAEELAKDPDWQLVIDWAALSRHARGRCAAKIKLRGNK